MGFAQTAAIENEFLPDFLTRTQKKRLKRQARQEKIASKPQNCNFSMQLPRINPLTAGQARTFSAFDDDKNLILHGVAGTGKTYISLYLALRSVLSGEAPKPVVITTWQSIYKLPKSWFEQFGVVIGDEAHLFKAKSLASIMEKLNNCKYRFGFTGTLDGTQTHKLVLEGLFGAEDS